MTDQDFEDIVLSAYISDEYHQRGDQKLNRIPYGVIKQFILSLQQKKPHLQIKSFQFGQYFSDLGNHYDASDTSPMLFFKTFDTSLQIYKTVQVQCLEVSALKFSYQKYAKTLDLMKQTITKCMMNEKILRIYDYFFINLDFNNSYQLYFVIESEFIFMSKAKIQKHITLSMDYDQIERFVEQCETYLENKFKSEVSCSSHDLFIVQNNDDSYSIKMNPLTENILSNLSESYCDDSSEIRTEKQKEQEENESNSSEIDERDDDSPEEQQDMEAENDTNIKQEKNLIRIHQIQGELIPKENLLSTLTERFPNVLELHDISIFEIISDHPKYTNFQIDDYDQNTFTFRLQNEQKQYFLRGEKYKSLTKAEDTYKIFKQLENDWNKMFIPVLDCQIIPLLDCTYLLFVEEDLSNRYSNHRTTQQNDNFQLINWMIEKAETLKQAKIDSINIYYLDIFQNNHEENSEEPTYYLSNPLFGMSQSDSLVYKKMMQSAMNNHFYLFVGEVHRNFSSQGYDTIDKLKAQYEKYMKNKLQSKEKLLINNYSYLITFIQKASQLQELKKIVPNLTVQLNSNQEIEIPNFQGITEESDNSLAELFQKDCFQASITLEQLEILLQKLQNPAMIKNLQILNNVYDQREHALKRFPHIFLNVSCLTIDIDDYVFQNSQQLQLESLNKLEKITLNFRKDCMYSFVKNYSMEDKLWTDITRQNLHSLLVVLQNDSIKSIEIELEKMFSINHDDFLSHFIDCKNKKELIDILHREQITSFFKAISSLKEQQETVSQLNIVSTNQETYDGMEVEESCQENSKKVSNSWNDNNHNMSEDSIDGDERSDKISALDQVQEELLDDIECVIRKFGQLSQSIQYKEIENNPLLEIRYEHSQNKKEEYLQFNLIYNTSQKVIELEIQTRYLERLSSKCCGIDISLENLLRLVEYWMESEQQIKNMENIFQHEGVSSCCHLDQMEFFKNLYSIHSQNLTSLTLELSYCEEIESQASAQPDFYGLSEFKKLQNLELILLSQSSVELARLLPEKVLYKNNTINTIFIFKKLNSINMDEEYLLEYKKIPRLVVLKYE